MRATVPLLRAALADALAAHRPSPTTSPRTGARPGDHELPVDEVTRQRARALLDRHRGGRR